MEAVTTLVRTGEDRTPSVFVPVPEPRGRPQLHFHARIRSPRDAEEARKSGVPVYLLEPEVVTALGYPIRFPPELVVARSALGVVETNYRTIPFASESAVLKPRFEDIALALLSINRLAARAVLERNREQVDATYLTKRVFQEDLEERAASVRFFELAPALPRAATPLPKDSLDRQLHKNLPTGRIP